MPGLAAGDGLALGRALGEFGATLMFAGSFQGITQTVPLAIYDRFATDFDVGAGALGRPRGRLGGDPAVGEAGCREARRSALLRVEAETRLGALELDVSLEVAAGRVPGARRARPARARPACCAWSPACCGHDPAESSAARRDLARHRRAASTYPPEQRGLRLRLPGVRALPAPERVAERGLSAARHAARRAARARASSCSSASASSDLADARPRTLSGGERQRVALARALARRPRRAAAR